MLIRPLGAMKIAQAYNPERRGGDLGRSRMGMSWMLRDILGEGKEYTRACETSEKAENAERPGRRPGLDQMREAFRGSIPVLVHTASGRGVMATARVFYDEFQLSTIVSHATFNGYKVAKEMAKRDVHVNVGPRQFDFMFSRDNKFYGLVAEYQSAGAKALSINTDAPVVPQEELFYQVAMAVRLGLDEKTALESVTINAARAMGIADRVGSIEVGKEADLVIKRGSLFDVTVPVDLVFVNGKIAYKRQK